MPLKADKFRPARAFMVTGTKGLPPVLLQAVEQKGAVFAVLGGQPGKGFCASVRRREPFLNSGASERKKFSLFKGVS